MIPLCYGSLHASAAHGAMSANVLDVNCRRHNLDIVEGKLRALGNDAAIQSNEGTTIVIETVAIAALLIRVQVNTSLL
jgi:hypothetical protein